MQPETTSASPSQGSTPDASSSSAELRFSLDADQASPDIWKGPFKNTTDITSPPFLWAHERGTLDPMTARLEAQS